MWLWGLKIAVSRLYMAEEIQYRLALKLKLRKIDSCGIAAPILLNEILAKNGFKTELVQGYCSVNQETCWHVWIETDGKQIDIGQTIASLKDSRFKNVSVILHKNIAPDAPAPQTDTETLDEWDLYQKDHKEFWKKQPMRVQNARAKLLNETWV
jgi:hypothetical protein